MGEAPAKGWFFTRSTQKITERTFFLKISGQDPTGHKKYLRTYIALSSIAASLLVGNKVALPKKGMAPLGNRRRSNQQIRCKQNHQRKKKQKLQCRCLSETILDAGGYGADQLTGMTQPNAYVVVCAEESKVGEQTADEVGRFAVPLGALPDGTATLQVKVYKDATQTFCWRKQSGWCLWLKLQKWCLVKRRDQQTIPTEPSSSAGQETQPEVTNDDSNTEQTGEEQYGIHGYRKKRGNG